LRRRILCLFICFGVLFFSLGCARTKGILPVRFDIAEQPQTLDPQFCQTEQEWLLAANLFENLTRMTRDFEAVPAAAEGWSVSDDGLIYTFILRQDLKWSNSSTVTADDFLFSFKRMFDFEHPSPWAVHFLMLKNADRVLSGELPFSSLGVEAPDEKTIVFKLERRFERFPEILSYPGAAPCSEKFFEAQKGRYGLSPKTLNENGPFMLFSWDDSVIVLSKNGGYRNQPASERIYLYVGRADDVSLFEQGKSDLCLVPYQRLAQPSEEWEPYFTDSWILMFSPDGQLGASTNLRAGLIGALEDELGRRLPQEVMRARGLIAPDSRIWGENYRELAGEVLPAQKTADAKALIWETLSRDDLTAFPKVTMLVADDWLDTQLGGVAQKLWQQKLSVYINLESLPLATLKARIESGRFDIAIAPLPSVGISPFEALSFFDAAFSDIEPKEISRRAGTDWESAQNGKSPFGFDGIYTGVRDDFDAKSSASACLLAEQIIVDRYYALPIYESPLILMQGQGVSGGRYLPSARAILFEDVLRKK
jgi:oligopeptide transport system substrate-binding protein